MLIPLFHLFASVLFLFAFYYDQYYTDIPFPKEYLIYPLKGRTVFLTFWCLILNNIYYPIALLNDVIGTNAFAPKKSPIIRKLKDLLYSLLFPVVTYVSVAFWGIYFVDKDKVFPEAVEKAMPVWLNHVLHTMIIVTCYLELLISNISYPARKLGVFLVLAYNVLYTVWFHKIYFETGIWVYPLFEAFSWPIRIAYITISLVIAVVIYLLGEALNRQITKGRGKTGKAKSR